MISKIKNFILGNKVFQPFFNLLFRISIKGMNYDRGQVFETSGEQWVLNYLKKKSRDSMIIFDVGANTGQYAGLVINTLKSNFILYSFEPSSRAYSELIKIKSENFFPNNIGFSEEINQNANLYTDVEGSVWGSLHAASHPQHNLQMDRSEKVILNTIDNFCSCNNIEKITLLKIDVEGHELSVLKGAQILFSRRRVDYIQFEFGLPSMESRVFLKDFFKLLEDYTIYRVVRNGIVELVYHERYELFLTTNYLAIRKDLV